MNIELKSQVYQVTKILKPTSAKFFKDIKVGNEILFGLKLRRIGRNRGLYATDIDVDNLTNDTHTFLSQNNLMNRLAHFELKKLDKSI